MTDGRFKLNAAVYLLLMEGDKILLLRRCNTGWSDGLYSLPAGHIDGGEPLTMAACREATEEVGVIIDPTDLILAHTMHRMSDVEYLDFFFVTEKWKGEPYNAEPEKCDDIQWFSTDNLPKNTLPYVRQVIEDFAQGTSFSEVGW